MQMITALKKGKEPVIPVISLLYATSAGQRLDLCTKVAAHAKKHGLTSKQLYIMDQHPKYTEALNDKALAPPPPSRENAKTCEICGFRDASQC